MSSQFSTATFDADISKRYVWLGCKIARAAFGAAIETREAGIMAKCIDQYLKELINRCRLDLLREMHDSSIAEGLIAIVERNGIRPDNGHLKEELEMSGRLIDNLSNDSRGRVEPNLQLYHACLFFWLNCIGQDNEPDVKKELADFGRIVASLEEGLCGTAIILLVTTLWATDQGGYRNAVIKAMK